MEPGRTSFSRRWGSWIIRRERKRVRKGERDCVRTVQASGHCCNTRRYNRGFHPLWSTDLSSLPSRMVFIFQSRFLPPLVSFKRNEAPAGRWWKGTWLIYARVKRDSPPLPWGLKQMYKQNLGEFAGDSGRY